MGDQTNLLANFIFLKVVANNIRDVFDANYFTPQSIFSNLQYKKENFLAYTD